MLISLWGLGSWLLTAANYACHTDILQNNFIVFFFNEIHTGLRF